MSERSKRLSESSRLLQSRLRELDRRKPTETQRPMHEVAVQAVKDELTNVGRQLRQEMV